MVDYYVTIGGVVVLDTANDIYYVDNYRLTMSDGEDKDHGSIYCNPTVRNIVNLDIIQEIIVQVDGTIIWRGEIDKVEDINPLVDIQCKGYLEILDDRIVSAIYTTDTAEAGEISAIAEDIITDLGYSIEVDATGTGTDQIIKKFICNNETAKNRVIVLKKLVNYGFWYDAAADEYKFKERNYSTFGTTIVVGGAGNADKPIWKTDFTNFMTRITLEGDVYEADTQESFNGTGSQDTFTLSFIPETIKVTVGGTEQVFGIEGQSGTYDYTVDKENKKVIFESGSIPGSGTNNVVVDYTYWTKVNVTNINDTAETTYNKRRDVRFKIKDLRETTDAYKKVVQLDSEFSVPTLSTTLRIFNVQGLKPALELSVVDDISTPPRNVSLPIRKCTYYYPEPVTEVEIGDITISPEDVLKSIQDRITEFNTKRVDNTIVYTAITASDIMSNIKERDVVVESATLDPDTLYWDLDNWDAKNWGDGTGESYSDVAIHQRKNSNNYEEYREMFYDSDYDSGTGTGTWDTSGQKILCNNTETIISSSIFLGSTASVIAITPTQTGTWTWEATADGGSNWETVSGTTAGVTSVHTFTTTGPNVKYRVTSGSASAEITNIIIEKRS